MLFPEVKRDLEECLERKGRKSYVNPDTASIGVANDNDSLSSSDDVFCDTLEAKVQSYSFAHLFVLLWSILKQVCRKWSP